MFLIIPVRYLCLRLLFGRLNGVRSMTYCQLSKASPLRSFEVISSVCLVYVPAAVGDFCDLSGAC